VFIKMSQSHRMKKSLLREAEALKCLPRHANVPPLLDIDHHIKVLEIKVGCASSTLPCLPLIGLIGHQAITESSWESCELKVVFDRVYDTLVCANTNGWAHLDVRQASIIASVDPSGNSFEVILIDWGCARRTYLSMKGFAGCLPFAHKELFGLK
jgi:hypothetical protein